MSFYIHVGLALFVLFQSAAGVQAAVPTPAPAGIDERSPGRFPTTKSTQPSPRSRDFSREQRTVLRQAIIDKLRVLALTRPERLIVVERVLDAHLDDASTSWKNLGRLQRR